MFKREEDGEEDIHVYSIQGNVSLEAEETKRKSFGWEGTEEKE